MTRLLSSAALVAALILGAGCESATDVLVEDLQGTWVASQVRVVDIELPKENNFDLIERGYAAIFVSDGSGDFVIRLDDPEGESEFITGSMEIDGTDIVIETADATGSGDVFLQDEQAALNLTGGLTFDFKGDGIEKPAKLLLVMDRESTEPTPL